MSRRPTRASAAGRAYLDLRQLARARHRPTAELLQMYALEGVLARLPLSPHASGLVLKGGVLLAAFEARRPTKDIDLSASRLDSDPETVNAAIRTILEIDLEDGLEFDCQATEADVIRESDDYSGVRVTVPCRLASARVDFHIDVNIGDPISPGPISVSIPRILGGDPVVVRGYPIAMVLAEKIVTALQRGPANTRWRDFVDIALLTRRHRIDAKEAITAIQTVAGHRQVSISGLDATLSGFATSAQPKWVAWRRRQHLDDVVPQSFSTLLQEVTAFADPILCGDASTGTWNPESSEWM